MRLRDHPLFRELISLQLPVDDFVVAGSAPMLIHGLKREISDIDIVARGTAWDVALELGQVSDPPRGPARRIVLFGGDIEVLDRWFEHSAEELIREAEFFDGIRFLSLARTLEWKNALGRDVDRADVSLIRDHRGCAQK
ncbi:hypothetical protein [Streptomyces sp. NPDC020362]|uniref:hypothetical protein n=1 Tax=unclassified Streptomyces TaxID=2593676 RepID=UPI0033F64C1D